MRWLVAALAIAAIAVSVLQLQRAERGLVITDATVGETPIRIFRPEAGGKAPVVVIAHGFAGSQQLMQPFALTLAKNGYIAVTFDFTGHGRNPVPMKGDIDEPTKITGVLVAETGRVADYAKTLPESDGRIAVLGHSMASDIVIRYAQAHPEVEATVAVSVFSPAATGTSPRNLLDHHRLGRAGDADRRRACASSIWRSAAAPWPARPMATSRTAPRGGWRCRPASNISACCTARTACAKRCNG